MKNAKMQCFEAFGIQMILEFGFIRYKRWIVRHEKRDREGRDKERGD